jgi:acyl dehydratase
VKDIEIGQSIPAYRRSTGFHAWNRYAAVNSEFVDIHMDDEAGRQAGYPAAFGMGNLQWAWLHCMLRTWLEGSDGRIIAVSCRFRAPSLKDKTVSANGTIAAIRPGESETEVDLDVWTDDNDGTRLTAGTATVAFPSA